MNLHQQFWWVSFGRTQKLCVWGTKVPVSNVLKQVARGKSFDTIIHKHYPQLTQKDIQSCVEFATTVVEREHMIQLLGRIGRSPR